ncbi:hypothetical protein Slu03_22870 [Sediminihabitans luteus]|nr:hypothetical protein Slu03_22870 [Sediminihabitans luteus]
MPDQTAEPTTGAPMTNAPVTNAPKAVAPPLAPERQRAFRATDGSHRGRRARGPLIRRVPVQRAGALAVLAGLALTACATDPEPTAPRPVVRCARLTTSDVTGGIHDRTPRRVSLAGSDAGRAAE